MPRKFDGTRPGIVLIVQLIVGLGILLPRYAYAQPDEEKGKFGKLSKYVKLSLGVSGGYTSNVDLQEGDSESSYGVRVEPGISLMVPMKKAYLETNYRYGHVWSETQENTDTHRVRALARYNFSSRTSVAVSHTAQDSEMPWPGTKTFTLGTTTYSLKKQIGPKLVTSASYSQEGYEDPSSPTFSNYDSNELSLAGSYRFSPRTTATLTVSHGDRDFDNSVSSDLKDYDDIAYSVGIRQELGAKVSLSADVGRSERDYTDQGSVFDSDDWTWSVGIARPMGERSTLSLSYGHSIEDTFYEQPAPDSPFESSLSLITNVDRQYRHMTVDRVGADWDHKLGPKDSISLGVAYQKSEADKELSLYNVDQTALVKDLDEDEYMLGLNYTHQFTTYLSGGIRLTHGTRDSAVREDYDYDTAVLHLGFSF